MGIIGDLLYRGVTYWQSLAGNTLPTRKFLTQNGTGISANAPSWDVIQSVDLPISGVTPGIYTNPTIEVDEHGIILSIANNDEELPAADNPFGESVWCSSGPFNYLGGKAGSNTINENIWGITGK